MLLCNGFAVSYHHSPIISGLHRMPLPAGTVRRYGCSYVGIRNIIEYAIKVRRDKWGSRGVRQKAGTKCTYFIQFRLAARRRLPQIEQKRQRPFFEFSKNGRCSIRLFFFAQPYQYAGCSRAEQGESQGMRFVAGGGIFTVRLRAAIVIGFWGIAALLEGNQIF